MEETQTETGIALMNPCTRKGNYFLVQEIKMTISNQNRHLSNSRNRSQEKNTGSGLRRSPRMPTATARYWNSIKAELRNPNQDE